MGHIMWPLIVLTAVARIEQCYIRIYSACFFVT